MNESEDVTPAEMQKPADELKQQVAEGDVADRSCGLHIDFSDSAVRARLQNRQTGFRAPC